MIKKRKKAVPKKTFDTRIIEQIQYALETFHRLAFFQRKQL